MTFLFTSSFFKKKRNMLYSAKILFLSVVLCVILCFLLKIVHIVFLKQSLDRVLEKTQSNNVYSQKPQFKYDFFQSQIMVESVNKRQDEAEIVVKDLSAKTSGGFIFPSKILFSVKTIIVQEIGGDKFIISSINHEEPITFELFMDKTIFKLPTVSNIKNANRLQLKIANDKNEQVGKLVIDDFWFGTNKKIHSTYMKNKGMLLLYKPFFVSYFISANRPFKWDIEFGTIGNYETWGLQDEHKAIVNKVEIKKGILDFYFSKISCSGNLTFDGSLREIDLQVDINNYKKLLEAITNSSIQQKVLDVKTVKQMYRNVNNVIIPKLKRNANQNSNFQDGLFLHIVKTTADEAFVNQVPASEIASSFNIK